MSSRNRDIKYQEIVGKHQFNISKAVTPFSSVFPTQTDIYSGEEVIRFNNRHPIYKSLMKLEFEDVLRNYQLKK